MLNFEILIQKKIQYRLLFQRFKNWIKGTGQNDGIIHGGHEFEKSLGEEYVASNLNEKQENVYRFINHWIRENKGKSQKEQILMHVQG